MNKHDNIPALVNMKSNIEWYIYDQKKGGTSEQLNYWLMSARNWGDHIEYNGNITIPYIQTIENAEFAFNVYFFDIFEAEANMV